MVSPFFVRKVIVYPKFVITMGVGYSICKPARGKEAWSFA